MSGDLKPLEWRKVGTFLFTSCGAGWSFHVYQHPSRLGFTSTGPSGEIGQHTSLEDACLACERDYERRVRALFERAHA